MIKHVGQATFNNNPDGKQQNQECHAAIKPVIESPNGKITKKASSRRLFQNTEIEKLRLQRDQFAYGIIAQMAAQQRLIQRSNAIQAARENEVNRQIIEICNTDSAMKSINFAKNVLPQSCEGRNSYRVISKLTE